MAAIPVSEILWLSLDEDGRKHRETIDLKHLCIQKLINDVSLLTLYLHRLHDPIHAMILTSAFNQRKTSAIKALMQWCPYEKITLPVPDVLKSIYAIAQISTPLSGLENAYKDFIEIAASMLSAFFDIIENITTDSQLHFLDFGILPVGPEVYSIVSNFLAKLQKPLSKQCTIKCAVVVNKSTDLYRLANCLEKANASGFHLVITGVCFYNNYYADMAVMDFIEHLNISDVRIIGFNYSLIMPSIGQLCEALHYFKHVRYLNMSYLPNVLRDQNALRKISATITEFPHLERLVIKGVALTGQLSMLLCEFCKRRHRRRTESKCCIVHNGTLRLLDISNCALAGKDIEILKELALKNSLRYLNISENSLEVESTCKTLLSLKSSLHILQMDYCFQREAILYDNKIFPLSAFKELRYLSMKGFQITEKSEEMLLHEISKLSKLKIIIK